MQTKITGRVWKYGDDVNTDVIFPGKYTYSLTDPAEMAKHALEDLDPAFVANVRPGDIIVAGKNWGCGSSREQAVVCLKEVGVGAIVARSFARIYFRNAINYALPIVDLRCGGQRRIRRRDHHRLHRRHRHHPARHVHLPPVSAGSDGDHRGGRVDPYTRGSSWEYEVGNRSMYEIMFRNSLLRYSKTFIGGTNG